MQRASYYFDTAWQTTQTPRRLLRANLAAEDLGLRPPPEMLRQEADALMSVAGSLDGPVNLRQTLDSAGWSARQQGQLNVIEFLRARGFEVGS